MNVKECLTSPVITIDENMSIDKALQMMKANEIKHLIITRGDSIHGVVSEKDLLDKIYSLVFDTTGATYSKMKMASERVKEVMQTEVVSIQEEDDISLAIEILLQGKFHCIPVRNKAQSLSGIITATDIMRHCYTKKVL